jgi:hypothetical protein
MPGVIAPPAGRVALRNPDQLRATRPAGEERKERLNLSALDNSDNAR